MIESFAQLSSSDELINYLLFRFTARGSAAALAHLCHEKMDEKMRQDIKTLFLKLCADDTPFVRRAAAQNILSMIKISRGPDGLVDYITAFKSFARDDQVRSPYLSVFLCLCVYLSLSSSSSPGLNPHTGGAHRHRAAGPGLCRDHGEHYLAFLLDPRFD